MTRRCEARSRRTGQPCRNPAMLGGTRCRMHGGASPQARRKAAERLAESKARAALSSLAGDVEPVTDAVGALESLAGEVVALTGILRGFVSELEEVRYRGGIGQGFEQLRGELSFYLQSLQRAESVLAAIVKLDLDARRVRLQERQAQAVVVAVGRVLERIGLGQAEQRQARALLAGELGVVDVQAVER